MASFGPRELLCRLSSYTIGHFHPPLDISFDLIVFMPIHATLSVYLFVYQLPLVSNLLSYPLTPMYGFDLSFISVGLSYRTVSLSLYL
jgi:hypothetical protein